MSWYHHDYYLGVDLGQAQDYSAIAVVEEPVWIPDGRDELFSPRTGWLRPDELVPAQRALARAGGETRWDRPAKPPLYVRHLERLALGTKYPTVVARVRQLLRTPPLADARTVLLVDATGVGRAVVDLFEHAQLDPVPITIVGGTAVTPDGRGFHVPQRELVSATVVVVEARRLEVSEALPEAATLQRELLKFQRRINPRTANDSYAAWREGEHDDLLFATALAVWYREHLYTHIDADLAERQTRGVA